jgi:hypothetical protein
MAVICLAAAGRAVDAAELNIVVRDYASGSVIHDADVTLLTVVGGTGVPTKKTTGANGAVTFEDLTFGADYSALAQKPGYTEVVRSGIQLGATEVISQDPNVPNVYATGATLEVHLFPMTANLSGNVWYEEWDKNVYPAMGLEIPVRIEIDIEKAYTNSGYETNCAENTGDLGACDFVNAVKKGQVQIATRYFTTITDLNAHFSFDGLSAVGYGYTLHISSGSIAASEYGAASFSGSDLDAPLLANQLSAIEDRKIMLELIKNFVLVSAGDLPVARDGDIALTFSDDIDIPRSQPLLNVEIYDMCGGNKYGEFNIRLDSRNLTLYLLEGHSWPSCDIKISWSRLFCGTGEISEGEVHFTYDEVDEVFRPATFIVTFNANGGAVSPASGATGADGKLAGLPIPTRAAVGNTEFIFLGWYTELSGGTRVTEATQFVADGEIYARWDPYTSVAERDREVPSVVVGKEAVVVVPASGVSGEFTVGPNPVARSAGKVGFFRQGKRVDNATLTVYDASGNVVSKVRVSDKALGTQDRRQVGEWNLKDSKGRLVPEGTYLVRGVVKTSDGKSEKVSVVVGVR